MHHSSSKINFLATTVSIETGKLKITLCRKPTDSQQYLDYTGHHPWHCKQGIFTKQARLKRRICSNNSEHVHHLINPKETLVEINYSHNALNKAYYKACKLDRKSALARRDHKAQLNQLLAFIMKCSNVLPNINYILRKYYLSIISKQRAPQKSVSQSTKGHVSL